MCQGLISARDYLGMNYPEVTVEGLGGSGAP